MEYWEDVYQDYKDRYSNKWTFWKIYNGIKNKYIMSEVFTEENRKIHSGLGKRGEKNPKAKLTEKEVLDIREKASKGYSNKELYNLYPFVSHTTIRNIINKKTWKHLL